MARNKATSSLLSPLLFVEKERDFLKIHEIHLIIFYVISLWMQIGIKCSIILISRNYLMKIKISIVENPQRWKIISAVVCERFSTLMWKVYGGWKNYCKFTLNYNNAMWGEGREWINLSSAAIRKSIKMALVVFISYTHIREVTVGECRWNWGEY